MVRRLAAVAFAAVIAAPVAANASPKDLAIHFSVPGLSVTFVDPGFRVAAPAYYPAPAYRPMVAPIYAPAYPVVVHYGPGYGAHSGRWHPHHYGNAGHPGRHGHDGRRGHWR